MSSLDQFVVNIRQLSLEGKLSELAQTLTSPSNDHLQKNIQHIDSILATFTLPEYSMVGRDVTHTCFTIVPIHSSVC